MPTVTYQFVKVHDVKRFFLIVTATSFTEALACATLYLDAWSQETIEEEDLPPYSRLYRDTYKPAIPNPAVIIDSVAQVHWMGVEVLNENLWLVFYSLGTK